MSRRFVCATLACAAALAVLSTHAVSLFPPGIHKRGLEFSVAKGQVLVDTPRSTLLDAFDDVSAPSDTAITYTLYLQTQDARARIARAAGIKPSQLAASGPFTELINRPNIVRKLPVPGPPKPTERDYRIVLDAGGPRPILTVYAQAPTETEAVALVRATTATLRQSVASDEAAGGDRASGVTLRPLGITRGGTVNNGVEWQLMLFVFLLVAGSGIGIALARARRMRWPATSVEPGMRMESAAGDDWPHTTRVLPWCIAAFLGMLFLVPFDAITLPVSIGIDGNLDRPVLGAVALVWIASWAAVRGPGRPRIVLTRVHVAALVFFSLACLGTVLNATALVNLAEFTTVFKKLILLGSYILFFVVVSSVVRPSEVPRFARLVLGLAVITAVATVIEYRTDFNVFYSWWSTVLPGSVMPPEGLEGLDSIGRGTVLGPTGHALELATLLGMAIPIAIVMMIDTEDLRRRALCGLALAVLVAGALATQRKTAVIAPLSSILVILAYRPRLFLTRAVPLGLVLGLLVAFMSPGAIQSMVYQLKPAQFTQVRSSQDRASDYDGVVPDITHHLLLGRGYDSYDPHKYRILDNEYLGLVVGVGFIGLASFLAILAAALSAAHPTIVRGGARSTYALAVAGALVVFGVSMLLFDALSWPHVPYLMFFAAALAVSLRRGAEAPVPALSPAPEPAPVMVLLPEPVGAR
jgi:hypothetical protein